MKVVIIKVTLPAWYENMVGQTFEVQGEPYQYCGGMGFMLNDTAKGILLRDCKVIEEESAYLQFRKKSHKKAK